MNTAHECIFCQILGGKSEATFVYQGEDVSAFMDLYPVTPGHMLVIPHEHYRDFSRVDIESAGKMFQLGRSLGEALRKRGPNLEGISYFLAEGEAAGQVVPHAHLHIIPRYTGDGCGLRLHKDVPRRAGRDDLELQAAGIREALNAADLSGV
jgi:histidine triad (HIT) family protein